MHVSRIIWLAGFAAIGPTSAVRAATLLPQSNLSDICPTVDERDTIQSVRAGLDKRLGAPIKEETLGTDFVLTYKQRDGSQLFVTLNRDNDKLEVRCDSSNQ